MTNHRVNEIETLLNQQSEILTQIMFAFKIALGENFLDYDKSVIYAHLSMIDDKIGDVININDKIVEDIQCLYKSEDKT